MRLIRFLDCDGKVRYGRPADPERAFPVVGDIYTEYEVADRPIPILARLAPVDPPNIFAIGRNYVEHAKEMSAEVEKEPLIFLKATTSVIGPDEPIILPASAPDEVDFEAELAVVIGRPARNVPESRAMEHVLGFTAANDVTARDCQKRRDKQWARGKSFDTFCPLGPDLVPAGSLDPGRLTVRSILNGREMQSGNTGDMIFSVSFLVSYLSHQFRLLPGTVILTGTPPGVGAARTPPVFLRAGDVIEVEIEAIARLTNRVEAASTPASHIA